MKHNTNALKDIAETIPNFETEETAMLANKKITYSLFFMALTILFVLIADSAAYATTTDGLEYETALKTFSSSITGPVAFFIAIIAMAASGFGIVFGGELTGWIKIACGIICIVGFIVFSSNIFQTLYSDVSTTLIMNAAI